jgi:acyl-CoA thioesterase
VDLGESPDRITPNPPLKVDTEFLQATFGMCAFHKHMGFELEVVSLGKVNVWVRYRAELDQAMGLLHGGVYAAAVDSATYYAALSHYGRTGTLPLTLEYKLNLLSTAKAEDLCATAEVLKAGRTVAVAEAKVRTASGKLVAVGIASFLIRQVG